MANLKKKIEKDPGPPLQSIALWFFTPMSGMLAVFYKNVLKLVKVLVLAK
jgi:hypothetical protein